MWFQSKIIMGCEFWGTAKTPYLTRVHVWRSRLSQGMLHVFHRSDGPEMHDHPWAFVSFILWRGYVEQTPAGRSRKLPGSILLRRAAWVHRIELMDGRPAVTFVITLRRCREWGFHTPAGWQRWKEYFLDRGC